MYERHAGQFLLKHLVSNRDKNKTGKLSASNTVRYRVGGQKKEQDRQNKKMKQSEKQRQRGGERERKKE